MQNFAKNLKLLREKKGFSQSQMLAELDIKRTTWNGYETGSSQPYLDIAYKIAEYFGVGLSDLTQKDLEHDVQLNDKINHPKKRGNVQLNVQPTVQLLPSKTAISPELKITLATDPTAEYGSKTGVIPITDISVAAGSGIFNPDYIENVEHVTLPQGLMKRGSTYLCVKIKGPSMAPTLQDGSYAIIRHLDKGEWSKMPDERIYVVSDTEGKTSIKRVKNRFKQGFIILKSDSPDQANFPNTTLHLNEINTIWYVEWYLSAKMPNIHDSYYSRLQRLEDRVEDFLVKKTRIGS